MNSETATAAAGDVVETTEHYNSVEENSAIPDHNGLSKAISVDLEISVSQEVDHSIPSDTPWHEKDRPVSRDMLGSLHWDDDISSQLSDSKEEEAISLESKYSRENTAPSEASDSEDARPCFLVVVAVVVAQ